MDDKSHGSGPSYLVDSWLEVCDWMGRSHLAVLFLGTAICRFYLHLDQDHNDRRIDDLAHAVSDE